MELFLTSCVHRNKHSYTVLCTEFVTELLLNVVYTIC